MTSKLKTDVLETGSGSGTIALNNQLSGMTTASLPTLTSDEMPAGSVVQVQTVNMSSTVINTSTSWVDVGGSITFTPKFTNSLILIMLKAHVYVNSAANGAWNAGNFKVLRDTTEVLGADTTNDYGSGGVFVSTTDRIMVMYSKDYNDSPNTTSAIVYKPQFMSRNGASISLNQYGSGSLTIMEING